MSTGDKAEVEDIFLLAGTTLDGRFIVERAIAEDGFGVVYRARQATLDRAVALKVLKTPRELGEAARQDFLELFAREARTVARITHPNIVQVYDFGVSTMPSGERAAWMALEWLTGVTLEQELVARRGRGGRAPLDCLALLRPVFSALATVHAAGVAHRDIKPANIMRVATPGGWQPKLLDFGIAKLMDEGEIATSNSTGTQSRQVAFSPWHAAPEQVSHARTGPWTDVHAMGLVLTEMLTDTPVFSAATSTALFQQILDRNRPTPSRFGVDVGAWEMVLLRATAVDPSARYRDARELLAALEATVGDARHVGPVTAEDAAMPETERAPSLLPLEPPTRMDRPTLVEGRSNAAARRAQTAVGPMAHPAATTVPWRRRSFVVALVALVALLGAGLAFARLLATPRPPPGAILLTPPASQARASPTVQEPALTAPPVETPVPPGTGVPPGSPSAATADAPAPTPVPGAKRTAAPHASAIPSALPPTPSSAARGVNCDPPFTVDARGVKHYKLECDN